MAQDKEGTELLSKLAIIADASQNLFNGKASVIFELKEQEYFHVVANVDGNYNSETFKIDISGTDFIFILDK
jgi:hypothetical protein